MDGPRDQQRDGQSHQLSREYVTLIFISKKKVGYIDTVNSCTRTTVQGNSEILNLLYPGECDSKWNPRGTAHNLRTSSKMNKVRRYHEKFYRPENMVIFVAGLLDKDKLFDSFHGLEREEQSETKAPFQKPFSKPCPSLGKVVTREKQDSGKLQTFLLTT